MGLKKETVYKRKWNIRKSTDQVKLPNFVRDYKYFLCKVIFVEISVYLKLIVSNQLSVDVFFFTNIRSGYHVLICQNDNRQSNNEMDWTDDHWIHLMNFGQWLHNESRTNKDQTFHAIN